MVGTLRFAHPTIPDLNFKQPTPSLRGAQRRSNPESRPPLDCFASLAMTEDTCPHSRGMFCPSFYKFLCPHPRNRGRRECRVRAAPAVSCAKVRKKGAHEHTGQRKHSDIPCAMALRLTSCSPRWSGLVVTVTPEKRASQELSASIAAPGPHDFAVRFGVFVRRKKTPDAKASIASRAQ